MAQQVEGRISVQDSIVHTIPDTLFHKGTKVRPTGKFAMEVEDEKGRKQWVRNVDTVAKPKVVKPEPADKAVAKSKEAAATVKPAAKRTRKAAAKTS